MDSLYQIVGNIFYVLVFCWIFFKIRNIFLIRKLNCKANYKIITQDIKKQKPMKYLFNVIKICVIPLIAYLTIGCLLGIFAFVMK